MSVIFIGHTGSTPLGDLWVAVSGTGLVAVQFPAEQIDFTAGLQKKHAASVEFSQEKVRDIVLQLQEYAAGQRKEFSLPIDWTVLGEFQRIALQATCKIPYGKTRTYKDIALEIGRPLAARAVGRAEATNPMRLYCPVIVSLAQIENCMATGLAMVWKQKPGC